MRTFNILTELSGNKSTAILQDSKNEQSLNQFIIIYMCIKTYKRGVYCSMARIKLQPDRAITLARSRLDGMGDNESEE